MKKKPAIIKPVVDDAQRAQILHSSVFARAQHQGMGVASTESFAQRQAIEQHRQKVRGYKDSLVAKQRFNHRPMTAQQRLAATGAGTPDVGGKNAEATNLYKAAEARAQLGAKPNRAMPIRHPQGPHRG